MRSSSATAFLCTVAYAWGVEMILFRRVSVRYKGDATGSTAATRGVRGLATRAAAYRRRWNTSSEIYSNFLADLYSSRSTSFRRHARAAPLRKESRAFLGRSEAENEKTQSADNPPMFLSDSVLHAESETFATLPRPSPGTHTEREREMKGRTRGA